MWFLAAEVNIDHVEWNGSDGNFASNCSEQPETLSLHQRRTPNTITLLNYTLLYWYKHRTNIQVQFFSLFVCFWQYCLHSYWSLCVYLLCKLYLAPSGSSWGQMIHSLTLRSGMENLQQEARLVLPMVRLSLSTLVKLVLSRGTEINHKSVMAPSASHRDLQSKSSPEEQALAPNRLTQSTQTSVRWALSSKAYLGSHAKLTWWFYICLSYFMSIPIIMLNCIHIIY